MKWVDHRAFPDVDRAILTISGMYCPLCVTRLERNLLSWPGVLRAEVDLEHEIARVDYEPSRVLYRDMVETVAATGAQGSHRFDVVCIA